jgi:hypothetical protein
MRTEKICTAHWYGSLRCLRDSTAPLIKPMLNAQNRAKPWRFAATEIVRPSARRPSAAAQDEGIWLVRKEKHLILSHGPLGP